MTTTPVTTLHHRVAGAERRGAGDRFLTTRRLDPSHGGINLGFPQNV